MVTVIPITFDKIIKMFKKCLSYKSSNVRVSPLCSHIQRDISGHGSQGTGSAVIMTPFNIHRKDNPQTRY